MILHWRRQADRRGLTLVEILVVLVILGIASAAAIPHIGDDADLQLAAASRLLVADLLYVQNQAIVQQREHSVSFDIAAGVYQLTRTEDDSSEAVLIHPTRKSLYRQSLGTSERFDKVSIDSVDFDSGPVIRFDTLGAPGNVNDVNHSQVVLRGGANTLTIVVAPITGRISVN